MKKKLILIIVIAVVCVAGIFIYRQISGHGVDRIPLDTVLEEASALTTQKLVITDAFESTRGNIPLINKTRFLIKYTTTVTAGFDVSKASVKESDSAVTVTIPHCTIDEDSIKIKSSDIKMYDTNFAIFEPDSDAILEVIGEAEERARKLASSDEYGFLEAADDNAVNLVKGLFESAAGGREVIVKFR
ncbi:MAG: DUF4230 domain-containing protein [Emergencia sp.]